MGVTGIGSRNVYYYNVETKRLQSSETGEENEFCKWFNGDLQKEQLSNSINGYDANIKDGLENMFDMYNNELKANVFQPSKNGNLCEISVDVLDPESTNYSINGREIFHAMQVIGYENDELETMHSFGPFKTHFKKDYNKEDNSINIAIGNRYDVLNGYQLVVREDWIEAVGYSKGETAYNPELERLILGLHDLIRFADQQWTSGSIMEECTPALLDFLKQLGVDVSKEFIINGTKCEVKNGRITEVGNTYGAPSSIYKQAIARYEELLYLPVNNNEFKV